MAQDDPNALEAERENRAHRIDEYAQRAVERTRIESAIEQEREADRAKIRQLVSRDAELAPASPEMQKAERKNIEQQDNEANPTTYIKAYGVFTRLREVREIESEMLKIVFERADIEQQIYEYELAHDHSPTDRLIIEGQLSRGVELAAAHFALEHEMAAAWQRLVAPQNAPGSQLSGNIKRLRKKLWLAQDAVADELGISLRQFQEHESGRTIPSDRNLRSYAKLATKVYDREITPDDFLNTEI